MTHTADCTLRTQVQFSILLRQNAEYSSSSHNIINTKSERNIIQRTQHHEQCRSLETKIALRRNFLTPAKNSKNPSAVEHLSTIWSR